MVNWLGDTTAKKTERNLCQDNKFCYICEHNNNYSRHTNYASFLIPHQNSKCQTNNFQQCDALSLPPRSVVLQDTYLVLSPASDQSRYPIWVDILFWAEPSSHTCNWFTKISWRHPKEVHIRFHAVASRPEGPAAPSIFKTVLRINFPSITSNMTGCGSGGGESGSIRDDSLGGCLGGCFFSSTPRTVSKVSLSTTLSNGSMPLPLLSVKIRRAARTFPFIINIAKILAVSSCFFGGFWFNWCWIVRPEVRPRAPYVFHFATV